MSTISASTTSTTAYKVVADTTGTLVLQTGSTPTTAATFDANQNMGLGVTPSAWNTFKGMQLVGGSLMSFSNAYVDLWQNSYYDGSNVRYVNTGYASYYRQNSGQHQWYSAASGTGGNVATFTQAMTLDASGNLLLGATSQNGTSSRVYIKQSGDDAFKGVNIVSAASQEWLGSISILSSGILNIAQSYVGSGSYQPITFTTGGSERARIDSSGNLLVGKTTTSATSGIGVQFQPTGYVNAVTSSSTSAFSTYELYSTGAGAYRFFVGANGTVYATSTTISSLSDVRYKENVRDLNVGLSEVMALKPRLYDWKEGKGADIKNARGFIAQEFEEVFPDLIDEWRDPAPEGEEPYKSVRADLIPVLVKAIQELKAIVDAQAVEIAALKGQA